ASRVIAPAAPDSGRPPRRGCNSDSDFPALSADGRFVAFASGATNLITPDVGGFTDVFVAAGPSAAGARLPCVFTLSAGGPPALCPLRRPHGGPDVPTPEGAARLRLQLVPVRLRDDEGLGRLHAWPGLPSATAGGGRAGTVPGCDDA